MQANPYQILEQLDPNNLNDYYDLDFVFADQHISVDLNFDHKTIDVNRFQMVKEFIANIEVFDKVNKDRIKQDYGDDNCDTVKTYIEYLIKDDEDIARYANAENQGLDIEQQLINKFQLVRVGLYPHGDTHFATFDYTISGELTDDLVVIFTNQLGEMDYMTLES